jgi:ectoine hydroxylase
MSPTATTADPYASRVGDEAEIRPRTSPVVWGSTQGPLGADRLQGFRDDGYLVLRDHLDPGTVRRLLDEVHRLAAAPELQGSELIVREPSSDELRSVFDVCEISPLFGELAADDRLAGVARQLLGDDVYIHQSRINVKLGHVGRDFPWHSDFETWHTEDGMPEPRAVSALVALTPNETWNGPLLVIGGSHHWYVSCAGQTPDGNYRTSLRWQEYGVPDRDSLDWLNDRGRLDAFTGGAGSVLFFDCNLMHGSPSNISPEARSNAFLVYNAVSNAVVEPFGGRAPRPDHIAKRQVRPLG